MGAAHVGIEDPNTKISRITVPVERLVSIWGGGGVSLEMLIFIIISQQAIMKVLRQDGRNKHKFNKARTFVYNKLTDHRCEERRRVSIYTCTLVQKLISLFL